MLLEENFVIMPAGLLLFRAVRKPSCGHCKSCKADRSTKLLTLSYPLTGAVYAAIPVLLYAPLIGIVVKKMRKDAPNLMKYLQYVAVVILLILVFMI